MEQYGCEEDRAKWAMHYAQVKAAIKPPKRTHKAIIRGKNSQGTPYNYKYKYADLADVDSAIVAAIRDTKENEKPVFSYFFDIDNGKDGVQVQTVLVDATTGYMVKTNKVWFRNANVGNAQTTASLISYAKRYSLSAAFGIASEDDDDAQNANQSRNTQVDKKAIEIIWNAYTTYHDSSAKAWITAKNHDNQTKIVLGGLLADYNSQQDKKSQKPKKDPHADKEVKKPMTDEQQNLFDDIMSKSEE